MVSTKSCLKGLLCYMALVVSANAFVLLQPDPQVYSGLTVPRSVDAGNAKKVLKTSSNKLTPQTATTIGQPLINYYPMPASPFFIANIYPPMQHPVYWPSNFQPGNLKDKMKLHSPPKCSCHSPSDSGCKIQPTVIIATSCVTEKPCEEVTPSTESTTCTPSFSGKVSMSITTHSSSDGCSESTTECMKTTSSPPEKSTSSLSAWPTSPIALPAPLDVQPVTLSPSSNVHPQPFLRKFQSDQEIPEKSETPLQEDFSDYPSPTPSYSETYPEQYTEQYPYKEEHVETVSKPTDEYPHHPLSHVEPVTDYAEAPSFPSESYGDYSENTSTSVEPSQSYMEHLFDCLDSAIGDTQPPQPSVEYSNHTSDIQMNFTTNPDEPAYSHSTASEMPTTYMEPSTTYEYPLPVEQVMPALKPDHVLTSMGPAFAPLDPCVPQEMEIGQILTMLTKALLKNALTENCEIYKVARSIKGSVKLQLAVKLDKDKCEEYELVPSWGSGSTNGTTDNRPSWVLGGVKPIDCMNLNDLQLPYCPKNSF